jgi:hypothetical protein
VSIERRTSKQAHLGCPLVVYTDASRQACILRFPGRKGEKKGVHVADVTYVSRVRVEPVEGKVRRAYLPVQEDPVLFGVHSEVAEHYGVRPEVEEPYDTTLDYLVAATGG